MISDDESGAGKTLSPGQLLAQGRVKLGLTQQQVAKELYATVTKVQALEQDNYAKLISDTFIRGYIRAYANLIKLDPAIVLAVYDELYPCAPAESVEPPRGAASRASRGVWPFLIMLGVFLGGLWLVSRWFFDNHAEAEYRVNTATLAAQVAESSSAQITPSEVLPVSVLAKVAVDKAPSNQMQNSSSAVTQAVTSAPVSSAPKAGNVSSRASLSSSAAQSVSSVIASEPKHNPDEITFSFSGESWLEVSDARGDVLATEMQLAGSHLTLVGQAPFDIKLGNAPVVEIQFNRKKIDVIPLLGSNVLTLQVGN